VRPREEIVSGEADLRSYLVGKNSVGIWRRLPTMVTIDPERELFPGLFAVALAACAFVVPASRTRRRAARLYAGIGAAAIVLSLGPRVVVWGHVVTDHGPYDWLLHLVPGMDGMRVPARMAIVFVAALAAIVGCGAAALVDRFSGWRQAGVAAVLGVAMIADGWAAPLTVLPYWPDARPEDRTVARWLRTAAPGPVMHLPITPFHEVELHHQFATLRHPDSIVNGFSGYPAPLQEFLRAPFSPLKDTARAEAVADLLAGVGVRYVALHHHDGDIARLTAALRRSPRLRRAEELTGVTLLELDPFEHHATSGLVAIDSRQLVIAASENNDRVPALVDGDADTRWFAGLGGQDGSSWIEVRLPEHVNVAEIALQFEERSWRDYPRRLRIDATGVDGVVRTLYDAAPYAELGAALAADARHPDLHLALPPNDSVALKILQTAAVDAAWSVHELRLWRR
jgi:hypothetical protein